MPVQTPFNPSRSFTSFGNSCSSNRLSLPTMARRPIVGGNWKCNPDSFSKLDDLIKIMKLEPTKERGCCWWNPWGTPLGDKKLASKFQMEMDGWQHIPELYKQNLQHAQFHRVTFSSIRNECDTSACDVFVCPSPLHVAYVASKVKDSELWNFCIGMCVWKSKIKHNLLHLASFLYVFMYVQENIHVCAQNCGFKGCGAFTGETAVEQLKEHRSAHQSDSIRELMIFATLLQWILESSYWRVPVLST